MRNITHKPITLLPGPGEENLKKYLKGLNVHPFVICKLMRGHTGREYVTTAKSILKHVDELAFEIRNIQQGKHYLAMQ